jgi:hypothetical protein
MHSAPVTLGDALADAVQSYRADADAARLFDRLEAIAADADIDALIAAAEPYRDIPEVAGPLYERIVARRPDDARALVVLASAYWLHGRGPEVVGALASRAIAAEPANRAAWHLWALTESAPRQRVQRWSQVVSRFPDDQLAAANLADNAASLAGAEHDPVALRLAIDTYEALLARAAGAPQRTALETALRTLRGWHL